MHLRMLVIGLESIGRVSEHDYEDKLAGKCAVKTLDALWSS